MLDRTEPGLEAEESPHASNGVARFALGMALGALVGGGAALLYAPTNGKRARRRIRRVAAKAADTVNDRWERWADELQARLPDAVVEFRHRR